MLDLEYMLDTNMARMIASFNWWIENITNKLAVTYARLT